MGWRGGAAGFRLILDRPAGGARRPLRTHVVRTGCRSSPCRGVADRAGRRRPRRRGPERAPGRAAPGRSKGSGSRRWMIRAERGSDTGSGSNSGSGSGGATSARTFLIGDEPDGFRTVVPLETEPQKGVWTAQVGFRCTTASRRRSTLRPSPSARSDRGTASWTATTSPRTPTPASTAHRAGAELGLLPVGAARRCRCRAGHRGGPADRPASPRTATTRSPSEHDQDPDRV